jgi:hypothetical protein
MPCRPDEGSSDPDSERTVAHLYKVQARQSSLDAERTACVADISAWHAGCFLVGRDG